MIIERLKKEAKVPVILVVNKIDKVHPDQLLAQIDDFRPADGLQEIIADFSFADSLIVDILGENLEEGFQYFPADQLPIIRSAFWCQR